MIPDPTVDELLVTLGANVQSLDDSLADYLERFTSPESALILLAALRTQRQRLHDLEALVEAESAKRMPTDRMELPGLLAERKGGAKRKAWDHERLTSRVLTDLCVDTETGEIDEDGYADAKTVADALLACAAVSYWRVGALKERGITFDDCVETEYGRRTVHLVTGDSTEPASEAAA